MFKLTCWIVFISMIFMNMPFYGHSEEINIDSLLGMLVSSETSIESGSFAYRFVQHHSEAWLARHLSKRDSLITSAGGADHVKNPRAGALEKTVITEGRLIFEPAGRYWASKTYSAIDGYVFKDQELYLDYKEKRQTLFDRLNRLVVISESDLKRSLDPIHYWRIFNEGRTWREISGDSSIDFRIKSVENDQASPIYQIELSIPISQDRSAVRSIWVDSSCGFNVVKAENMSAIEPGVVFSRFEASYRQHESGLFFPERIRYTSFPGNAERKSWGVMTISGEIDLNIPIPAKTFRLVPPEDVEIQDSTLGLVYEPMELKKNE